MTSDPSDVIVPKAVLTAVAERIQGEDRHPNSDLRLRRLELGLIAVSGWATADRFPHTVVYNRQGKAVHYVY